MQIDRNAHVDPMPRLCEENRAVAEIALTAGVAFVAANLLPTLEKTVPYSSAILSIGQNIMGNRFYHSSDGRHRQTNWFRFMAFQMASGVNTMAHKMAFDILVSQRTDYNPTIIITTSLINTASATLFRYMTRN